MDNLNEIIVRIKADTSSFNNPIDVLRGEIPQFWRGNDIRFEIGIFDGENVLSVSNYASISLAIRKLTDDGKVPSASTPALMQKVCTSFDDTLTSETWGNGTKQHAAIPFSSGESNVVAGDHWLSIWATTSDTTPKIITLCAGIVRILEVGGGNFSTPPDPIKIYYTSNECDDRFIQLAAIDSNTNLGASNSVVPSQGAVKTYVDQHAASGQGEATSASNLGTGTAIFKEKVDADLKFKTLKAGDNVTISANGSEVTISSSATASEEGMLNPMTTEGDIIVGDESGAAVRLGKGSDGQVLKSTVDGLEWADESSSYTLPTASAGALGGIKVGNNLSITDGVLSADDQTYTLPTASAGALGGIKVGDNLNITDGVLSADGQTYTLPTASASALGGIKVGNNLSIADGVLSADGQTYTLPTASASALGGVKVGDNLSIADGVLSADGQTYTLPTASASALGGVKVGDNLSITDGVLSADDQTYTLPTASASALGGVKVGDNLSITNGVLSADGQTYTLPTASASALGGIKVGDNLTITDGVLSADDQTYTLPTASANTLGGIRPDGTTIAVNSSTGIASVVEGNSGGNGSSDDWIPSSQYVDITYGVAGDTYIAPADGWVYLECMTFNTNAYIVTQVIINEGTSPAVYGNGSTTYSASKNLYLLFPVGAGYVFKMYNSNLNVDIFRFIYAKGAI